MKRTSALKTFNELGGLTSLWSMPDASHVETAMLLEATPSIRHVQELVDNLPEYPSADVLAALLLAVGHACQSHPMLLLTPLVQSSEHVTLEEFLAQHVKDLVSDLQDPSTHGYVWEGRWAPLVLQVRVHEALHELERLLRRLQGVGPVWSGPSIEAIQEVTTRLAQNVGLYHCDDHQGLYLAPSLDRSLEPLQVRTAAGAHVLGTRFIKNIDLNVDVARGLLDPALLAPTGLRSLHKGAGRYQPTTPLLGAVDPLDTAAAADGLDTLGFHAAANQLWARLASADHSNYPRFLSGENHDPAGKTNLVTVGCSLAAKYRIGTITTQRQRDGEDLPVGPVEEELLALLGC